MPITKHDHLIDSFKYAYLSMMEQRKLAYQRYLERLKTYKTDRWFWRFMGMDVRRLDAEMSLEKININQMYSKIGRR